MTFCVEAGTGDGRTLKDKKSINKTRILRAMAFFSIFFSFLINSYGAAISQRKL
jgi:hypothetical protein